MSVFSNGVHRYVFIFSRTIFALCKMWFASGSGGSDSCINEGTVNIRVEEIVKVGNIDPKCEVHVFEHQAGYEAGFKAK
ncbi:hypothetical protein CsSME_00037847 [Camellia sinensis var. sinensis]